MKSSLIVLSCFIIGLLCSSQGWLPLAIVADQYTLYVLYLLMFCVGISIGRDRSILPSIRRNGFRMLLLPLITIVGTLFGIFVASFFIDRPLADCLAVGSGFGYYSLSSIFITQYKGVELGVVALLCNIIRELITLLFAPLLVSLFGKMAPIAAGGATTMDSTLPVITVVSGNEFVMLAIVHGIVVDASVPLLVTFFCTI